MMLFTFSLFSLIPAAVLATYTIHQVNVGANGKLEYEPDYVNAHPGDVVRFDFFPKNHTVTQFSLDNPCVPLADGLNSGFVPVAPDAIGNAESYFVLVKDYSPLWFYSQQANPAPGHCVDGMVFAINPPSASLANYKASALVVAAREVENSVDGSPSWRRDAKETVDGSPSWRREAKESVDGSPSWREAEESVDSPVWHEGTDEDIRKDALEGPPPKEDAPDWRRVTKENEPENGYPW